VVCFPHSTILIAAIFFPLPSGGALITGTIEIETNYNAKRIFGKKNPSCYQEGSYQRLKASVKY